MKNIAIILSVIIVITPLKAFPSDSLATPSLSDVSNFILVEDDDLTEFGKIFERLGKHAFIAPDIIVCALADAFEKSAITLEDCSFSSQEGIRIYNTFIRILQENYKNDPSEENEYLFQFFLTGDKAKTIRRRNAFENFLIKYGGSILISKEKLLSDPDYAVPVIANAAWEDALWELSDTEIYFLTLAEMILKHQVGNIEGIVADFLNKKYAWLDPGKFLSFWLPFVLPFGFDNTTATELARLMVLLREEQDKLIKIDSSSLEIMLDEAKKVFNNRSNQPFTLVTFEYIYNGLEQLKSVQDRTLKKFLDLEKRFIEQYGDRIKNKNMFSKLFEESFADIVINTVKWGYRKNKDFGHLLIGNAQKAVISKKLQQKQIDGSS